MATNRLYLGEMTHKGQSFPGQHEPIITPELWAAVHAYVERRKMGPRIRHKKEPALLTGLLYAPDNQRMLPTYTQSRWAIGDVRAADDQTSAPQQIGRPAGGHGFREGHIVIRPAVDPHPWQGLLLATDDRCGRGDQCQRTGAQPQT